jgi:hypothetical protein
VRLAAAAALVAAALLAGCPGGVGLEPPAAPPAYAPAAGDVPNPERGFYVPDYDAPGARGRGVTLVRHVFDLAPYRERPLSPAFLDGVASELARARRREVKLVPRFAYGFRRGTRDATRARVVQHLRQLAPVLREHADAIAFVEAGLIGWWGEWHHSSNGLIGEDGRPNAQTRRVLAALLRAVPRERMVAVRYPAVKQALLGRAPVGAREAGSGSARARVGHHDDCMFASPTHWGTYPADRIAQAKAYVAADTRHVVQGGETCSAGPEARPLIACPSALRELERLHVSTLNARFHPDVLETWRREGCLEEIRARLGYRFVLQDAEVPATVARGGRLEVALRVDNEGFAAPYNHRPVELVLRRPGAAPVRLATRADARDWQPGDPRDVRLRARLPRALPPGSYEVLLALPDPAPRLRGRPGYAVRLANEGLWEPATGLNALRRAVEIG